MPLEELALALVLPLGLLDLGVDFGHLGPGGGQLRPRGCERRLSLEDLALPVVVPLGLVQLGADLGDLRAGGGRCARASASCALASVSSSRASTVPSSTRMPSSISTSVTLPVILAETVAWRRAVT